jgi:hypothetical protein
MTPVYINIGKYGDKHYYKDKAMTILHREDGPAVEHAGGGKAWYSNGKLHREDGPAIEYADGSKFWFVNGKLHREDGPAVEHSDGGKEWYVNGVEHGEREFLKRTAKEIVLTMDEIASKFGIEVSKLKITK